MWIRGWTYFDITATGVRGNFNANRMPFTDQAQQRVIDEKSWHRSRNQQRNWDTITQLFFLRVSPVNIDLPRVDQQDRRKIWRFGFEIDDPAGLASEHDPLGALKIDCQGVPMILRLGEDHDMDPMIVIDGNTFFMIANK